MATGPQVKDIHSLTLGHPPPGKGAAGTLSRLGGSSECPVYVPPTPWQQGPEALLGSPLHAPAPSPTRWPQCGAPRLRRPSFSHPAKATQGWHTPGPPSLCPTQPPCQSGPSMWTLGPCPPPASLSQLPGPHRGRSYTRPLLQEQEMQLFHLIQRNKCRKSSKMRRQRQMFETEKRDKTPGGQKT